MKDNVFLYLVIYVSFYVCIKYGKFEIKTDFSTFIFLTWISDLMLYLHAPKRCNAGKRVSDSFYLGSSFNLMLKNK